MGFKQTLFDAVANVLLGYTLSIQCEYQPKLVLSLVYEDSTKDGGATITQLLCYAE